MKPRAALIAALAAMSLASPTWAGETYNAVLAAKKCSVDHQQLITCEYKIGKNLYISIPGIGTPSVGVTFFKSDWDGDYYATFGMMHQCVVIKPGNKLTSIPGNFPDMAFISPRSGKVYQDWEACRSGI